MNSTYNIRNWCIHSIQFFCIEFPLLCWWYSEDPVFLYYLTLLLYLFKEIKSCLSVDSDNDWSNGRHEVCTETEMFLTSLTFLNLPFVDVDETWEINAINQHTVQLHILDFYNVCPKGKLNQIATHVIKEAYQTQVLPLTSSRFKSSFTSYWVFCSRQNNK